MSGGIFEVGDTGLRAVWRVELRGGAWEAFPFAGEKGGCPSRALYGERCGFSGLAEGTRPGKGICRTGRDGRVERGGGIGMGGYGHWLVRVPPELVLGVGEVRVPPLPMEEVGLLQPATRPYLGGLADGAAGMAILVQLDDIDIQISCAEGGMVVPAMA
jgi:hypothetical protein